MEDEEHHFLLLIFWLMIFALRLFYCCKVNVKTGGNLDISSHT